MSIEKLYMLTGAGQEREDTSAPFYPFMLSIFLILIVTVVSYANSLNGDLIYDDHGNILHNQSIRDIGNIGDILSLSVNTTSTTKRPVLNLSFALNHAIHGLEVEGYHFINTLIHFLSALVLFGVIRRTLLTAKLKPRFAPHSTWLALTCALIWVAHPLNTESVTYISQRGESMAGLFSLVTLYCAIRGWQTSKWWHSGVLLFCALGVGTKQTVLGIPFLVFFYDLIFISSGITDALRRSKFLYLSLLACFCLALFITGRWILNNFAFMLEGKTNAMFDQFEYARSQPKIILHYIRLALWPAPLCLLYNWPASTMSEAAPYISILGLLSLAMLYGLFKRHPAAFPAAFFFMILAPSSSFYPLNHLVFEHRFYLPLAAVITLAVLGSYHLLSQPAPNDREEHPSLRIPHHILITGLALLVISLSITTINRNKAYQSRVTMWRDVVGKRPHPNSFANLSAALTDSGDWKAALQTLKQGLTLFPDDPKLLTNAGSLYFSKISEKQSIPFFEKAVAADPLSLLPYYYLGLHAYKQENLYTAENYFKKAVRLSELTPEVYFYLGNIMIKQGKIGMALSYFEKKIALEPSNAAAYNNIAPLLFKAGEKSKAIAYWQKAVQLKPDFIYALNNLGVAYLQTGQLKKAVSAFRKTLELMPTHSGAQKGLKVASQRLVEQKAP